MKKILRFLYFFYSVLTIQEVREGWGWKRRGLLPQKEKLKPVFVS